MNNISSIEKIALSIIWFNAVLVANYVNFFNINTYQPKTLLMLALPLMIYFAEKKQYYIYSAFLSLVLAFAFAASGQSQGADIFSFYSYLFIILSIATLLLEDVRKV